ncbi:hypothetical protein NEDG_00161 [Nematocida displodere]|uniref:Uncharacterized protein n=1 Tax=Nematocida displodere TaxID=1805483 RepID=A0A177EIZ0_9MICR|nr:hypothetical protein NEDG_00161 [Nematocida displodere]
MDTVPNAFAKNTTALGQVVRIVAKTKQIIHGALAHIAVFVLKNNGRVFFLTIRTEAPNTPKTSKAPNTPPNIPQTPPNHANILPQDVQIGQIIEVPGVASEGSGRLGARHVQSSTGTIRKHEGYRAPYSIRLPIAGNAPPTPLKSIGNPKTQPIKVALIVKGIKAVGQRVHLQCIDENRDSCEVILSTHASCASFKYQDILILTDLVVWQRRPLVLKMKEESLAELSPVLPKTARLAQTQAALSLLFLRPAGLKEILSVAQDAVILIRCRILQLSLRRRAVKVADHTGCIELKLAPEEMSLLVQHLLQSPGAAMETLGRDALFMPLTIQIVVLELNGQCRPHHIVIKQQIP